MSNLRQDIKRQLHKAMAILNTAMAEERSLTDEEREFVDEAKKYRDEFINQFPEEDFRTVDGPMYNGHGEKISGPGMNYTSDWTHPETGESVRVYNRDNVKPLTAKEQADQEKFFYRAITTSTSNVPLPDNIQSSFIQTLSAKNHLMNMGAQLVDLKGQHKITRVASWPTVDWRASENVQTSPTDGTYEEVEFDEETCMVITKVSNELLQDSPNMAKIIVNSFAEQIAYELDRVALHGSSGSNEPVGLDNMTGLSTEVDAGDAAISDYGWFWTATQNILTNNSTPTGVITHPKALVDLYSLTDTAGQYIKMPPYLEKLQWRETTSFPTNGGSGSSTYAFVGNFNDLMIGIKGPIVIKRLNEFYADYNATGFLFALRMDVQAVHEESFCKIKDIAV